MAYVTPVHYYSGRQEKLRLIVIHTMESPENDDTAENVAAWFAGKSGTAPLASAHACVDNNSVVLCLPPSDTAWAAPGANADGYQIEQAGRAAQGIAGWADAYSQSMLRLSAAHARQIAQAAGIPLVHLTDAQLAAGAAGFVGHDQVSRVHKKSDHTDPGPDFPWTQYMSLVNRGTTPNTDTTSQQEDNMIFVIFENNGRLGIYNPYRREYQFAKSKSDLEDMKTVITRTGGTLKEWKQLGSNSNKIDNLSALGSEVK